MVGRTGSGKTALLSKLRESDPDHTIWLDPVSLSMHYLSGSTILKNLTALGVRLDFFYKLLWNHILVVELLKLRYPMIDIEGKSRAIEYVRNLLFRDAKKQAALRYLDEWGGSFWEKTEVRIKQTTEKFEEKLNASFASKIPGLDTAFGGNQTLSGEQKADVRSLSHEVVNSIQMTELDGLMRIIKEDLFASDQQSHYIVVDRLDEDWVEDEVKYRLIKSLLDCVLDFGKVPGVKIVVALRKDLVERVFRVASSSGTQGEKFGAFYLEVQWSREDLMSIADKRVAMLVKRRYHSRPVGWRDIMVKNVGVETVEDYLTSRTLFRPRDMVVFLNMCIKGAQGEQIITATVIRNVEGDYSRNRLESIKDEWRADYPDLEAFLPMISGKKFTFRASSISDEEVEELCLDVAADSRCPDGPLKRLAVRLMDDTLKPLVVRRELLSVFHKLGLLGLKKASDAISWSFRGGPPFLPNDIKDDTSVSICPTFHRALGVKGKLTD